MLDLVGLLGIRLQLLVGHPDAPPRPAPYEVIDALIGLEVTNDTQQQDSFQLEFSLGKNSFLEYELLRSGILDAHNRMTIKVIFGVLPQVLIDGIITDLQIIPSNDPGRSTLRVTGEDSSVKLDLKEQNLTYPNQKDSAIVEKILRDAGFIPQVTETKDAPRNNERVPTQQCSHLRFIRQLARRNGFVFYVESTPIPGRNIAYWGPEKRAGSPQPALSMNMGAQTNVDTPINFHFNALGPTEPEVNIIDPLTKRAIRVPLPGSLLPALSAHPARPMRKTIARDTANLSFAQALSRATAGISDSSDAIEASGQVDAVRYGRALRARRSVDVRGAGKSYNGTYYVRQVVHRIRCFPRGEYTQSFTLTREGRGALSNSVATG